MEKKEQLYEGKAKKVYATDEEGYVTKVIMEYEDGDQWACYCSWK